MKIKIKNTTIRTVQGDITKAEFADVIVNSAGNSSSGGGVNAAIHKAAGKGLTISYTKQGGFKTGEAIITPAFKLPCKYVIHTKGPIWTDGNHNEVSLLISCYKKSLELAEESGASHHGIYSIAFPSISTGVHGFPTETAAYTAVHAVADYLYTHHSNIEIIYWIFSNEKTKSAYDKALATLSSELKLSQNSDGPQMIGFYHEYEQYGCFSNWYPSEFDYAGKHYANSEQYMMYHKVMMFGRKDFADQIMQTTNPAECKCIAGQKFPEFNSVTWGSTCYTIVKRGVKAKFRQNQAIGEILLGTGNALLAECSLKDKKWGIDVDINDPDRLDTSKWNGKNMLGRILMEIRGELRLEKMLLDVPNMKKFKAFYSTNNLIPEWEAKAGIIEHIPQYHAAVHAYADTIATQKGRDRFYHQCSLYEWELQMKVNNGGRLPLAGFYEMKQEIYEVAWRVNCGI